MILHTKSLRYTYGQGKPIHFPDLRVNAGDKILIMGPSGSGKSTFLNLISGAIPLQSGSIQLNGTPYGDLKPSALDRLRADHLGVIFQTLNLIPYLSGAENAALGLRFSKRRQSRVEDKQVEIQRLALALGLTELQLAAKASHLSIGQQQRIAVIRALLGRPELILADEPTSALDPVSTDRFVREMLESFDPTTQAIVLVSHNPALKQFFDRVIEFEDISDD